MWSFFKPKKKKSLLADFAFETIKCNQRDPPCRFRLKVSFFFFFLFWDIGLSVNYDTRINFVVFL